MKTLTYQYPYSNTDPYPAYYQTHFPNQRLLFFDIETTGLAAKNSTLYLIGVLWFESDGVHITQWFNEDGYSEKQLLKAFETFCSQFTHLVHFNGTGFDLPYLRQKASLLNISITNIFHLEQFDILKEIRPYKKLLLLANLKQVTIEAYLDIQRKDTYNGKELIHIYQRYIAKPETHAKQLLLQHNHDDLLGMSCISKILNYKAFFEDKQLTITDIRIENNTLLFIYSIPASFHLLKRITCSKDGLYLNAFETSGTLSVPIYHDTLKYYFKDYKNYYYLPLEDTAIHKSIASYVDASNKEKATKNTCYVRQEDDFIPCFTPDYDECFYHDLTDNMPYQRLSQLLEGGKKMQTAYLQDTLSAFSKK